MNTAEIDVMTMNYMGKLTVELLGSDFSLFAIYLDSQILGLVHPAKTLEPAYTNFNFNKPHEPVYIEAKGHIIKSNGQMVSSAFDSTLVITKLIKITREIPYGSFNQ